MSDREDIDRGFDSGILEKQDDEIKEPEMWNVLLHNDNYTTMEFVVQILMNFFHKDEAEATHIMLMVHHRGYGVAGVYSRDIAETKVVQVSRYAQDHGMPLKLSAECLGNIGKAVAKSPVCH